MSIVHIIWHYYARAITILNTLYITVEIIIIQLHRKNFNGDSLLCGNKKKNTRKKKSEMIIKSYYARRTLCNDIERKSCDMDFQRPWENLVWQCRDASENSEAQLVSAYLACAKVVIFSRLYIQFELVSHNIHDNAICLFMRSRCAYEWWLGTGVHADTRACNVTLQSHIIRLYERPRKRKRLTTLLDNWKARNLIELNIHQKIIYDNDCQSWIKFVCSLFFLFCFFFPTKIL